MAEETGSESRVAAARRKSRRFWAEGMFWLVYELTPSAFDRRSAPSLVFENDAAVRLVRTFPSNWRELSDEYLYALSFGT